MAGLTETANWEAEIYQLERTDAVVGGVPNVTTKAGTSNIPHLLLANRTRWLRDQVLGLQSGAGYRAVLAISAGQTLTAADMGECLVFTGTSAATLTLPAISDVPEGSAIEVINTGTANLTIAREGSDQIDTGPSLATSLVVPPNQSAKLLRATGSAHWHPISLPASALNALFGSSIGANGWQRFPSGLIMQWGNVASIASTPATASITFPISFTSAVHFTVAGFTSSIGVDPDEIGIDSRTVSGMTVRSVHNNGTSSFNWFALGV